VIRVALLPGDGVGEEVLDGPRGCCAGWPSGGRSRSPGPGRSAPGPRRRPATCCPPRRWPPATPPTRSCSARWGRTPACRPRCARARRSRCTGCASATTCASRCARSRSATAVSSPSCATSSAARTAARTTGCCARTAARPPTCCG
jgi:hypothetical protein